MKDTCLCEKCPLWKKYYSRKNGQCCPNYIETSWTSREDNQPVLIKDCAPKRSVLMMMDMQNRLFGTQQAAEQARNKSEKVSQELLAFTNIIRKASNANILIEDSDDIPKLSNS